MRNYLLYSTTLHAAVLAGAAVLLLRGGISRPPKTYRIDFIGPAGAPGPVGPKPGPKAEKAAAKPAPKPAPKPKAKPPKPKPVDAAPSDELVVSKDKTPSKPLPKPSILYDPEAVEEAKGEPEMHDDPGMGGAGGSSIVADLGDFPYPWYITRVRTALWDQWTRRMPRGGHLHCIVLFSIQRDGSVRAVEVEEGSGNSLYDYAAMGTVNGAAPFPPLPPGYPDRELRVHVELRSAP